MSRSTASRMKTSRSSSHLRKYNLRSDAPPVRDTKKMAHTGSERFQSAHKYAAYLETAEGRLRLDLGFANLRQFLPQSTQPLRVLDVGCGTGAIAVRLAR